MSILCILAPNSEFIRILKIRNSKGKKQPSPHAKKQPSSHTEELLAR